MKRDIMEEKLTCMPANDLESGFLCTRRTSFCEFIIIRLADGRGVEGIGFVLDFDISGDCRVSRGSSPGNVVKFLDSIAFLW